MVDTNKLRGIIAERRKTQNQVARAMGISPKSFYNKMQRGVFGTDEAEKIVEYLAIENPAAIFFAKEVTCEVAEGRKG